MASCKRKRQISRYQCKCPLHLPYKEKTFHVVAVDCFLKGIEFYLTEAKEPFEQVHYLDSSVPDCHFHLGIALKKASRAREYIDPYNQIAVAGLQKIKQLGMSKKNR